MVSPDTCLFCKLARGELPSVKVYESEHAIAFLDINPAAEGHALVIPKKHAENVFELDAEHLGALHSVAKEIAARITDRLGATGVNILQNNGRSAGQIVDHYHIHVIPRHEDDGVMLKFPRNIAAAEHLEATARKLRTGPHVEEKPAGEKRPAEKKERPRDSKARRDLDFEMEL